MSFTLPLIVYGNGDLYREIFNAIATVMHTSGYHHLLHLSILLTGTWAIFRYSVERDLIALVKWLASYYFAFFVLFIPTATVEILDQVNQGKAYAVDNVPLGIAVMSSYTSRIGAGLTELTEEIFSLPDDLKYSQTGMVMASRLVVNASQFQMTDPSFMQSMQGFVHQCVFYDILLNKYTVNDMLGQKDVWQFLSQNASRARSFLYYPPQNAEGVPSVVTCETGARNLTADWNAALDQTAALYGARLFPEASDPKAQLLSNLPGAYDFLAAQTSLSATDILKQNILSNAIQNGIVQMGATTNAPAALEGYALTKAQLQKRLGDETAGDMAAYWLPLMKNVFEAILYGSFIFVFLLVMFPFGGAVLKNYVGSLLCLQMWAPLYAILNLCMNFYAQVRTLSAMGVHGQMGLNLYSQAGIAQVNADMSGLAGYLSLSIPFFAYGLVRGISSVFSQAAQSIAGVAQGAVTSASAEAFSGSYSMGNLSYNHQSSVNTSANHFDTSGRVSGGMYTTQTADASTLSKKPNSSVVMNNVSNQGASANLGVKAETAGSNPLKASSVSTPTAVRDIGELSHNTEISTSKEKETASAPESTDVELHGDIDTGLKVPLLGKLARVNLGGSVEHKWSSDNESIAPDHAISHGKATSAPHSVITEVHGGVELGPLEIPHLGKIAEVSVGGSIKHTGYVKDIIKEEALKGVGSSYFNSGTTQTGYETLSQQDTNPQQNEGLVTHHPDMSITEKDIEKIKTEIQNETDK